MIYLASPYSHSCPYVREERYLRVLKAVATLAARGEVVYSPIVHWHEIAKVDNLPKSAEFWSNQNFGMLKVASKLLLLRIEGWQESVGMQLEKAEAMRLNIPVEYL